MAPVIRAVAREFGLTEAVVVTGGKLPTPVLARMVCYWLARKLRLRLTDTEIYRALGRKRVVIQRSVDEIDKRRGDDVWLREVTDRLLVELSAA